MTPLSTYLRPALVAACAALVVACSDGSDRDRNPAVEPPIEPPPPPPENTYEADIVWTEYGIPHVTAEDWGSLGYGSGYAYATENFCVAMKEYVRARGESARYLGEEGDLDADLVYKLFNDDERIERISAALPDYLRDMLAGYAAGLNRFLNERGIDQLAEGPEGCRGAPWVREVDVTDMLRLFHKLMLRTSADALAGYIVAAQAPEGVATAALRPSRADWAAGLAALDPEWVSGRIGLPEGGDIGSNAYAVGEQGSQSNSGILFGNPHFPWQGPERFTMFHLTLGDEYDVMGAALHGVPLPVIGFNRDLAWSHTVSTGRRFTLYELQLNPDNPLEYLFDGEPREIEARTVSAEVDGPGGVETVEHTFYLTHFGPIVDLAEVSPLLGGWPNAVGTLLTYRDANLENLRGLDQWVRMGQAGDLEEFQQALTSIGIPWVNTIAADRFGNAFYGDITVNPHVEAAQFNTCVRGQLQSLLTDFGLPTMDGSDADCEWGSDEDAPVDGIFGYDSLPKLATREYAANANDSYWLSNPRNLLTGYPPIIGREEVPQSLRTRHTFSMAEDRIAGSDELGDAGFDIDTIRTMSYQATNHAAELVADDAIAICEATDDWAPYSDNPDTAAEACAVMAAWDQRFGVDSVGAHIFREFWFEVRGESDLWAVPFDPADPVYTPRELNPALPEAVREAFGSAVDTLVEADIPMDRPFGEIQYVEKNGERIGIHGGPSSMMFSVISSELVPGEGYSNIVAGNSYMQAVTWDESDCPDAYAMLTYSQSTDPASDHYADATRLYSEGGWIDVPFCEADRDAQELRRASIAE